MDGTEPVSLCNRLAEDGSYLPQSADAQNLDPESSLVDRPALPEPDMENNQDGLFN